LPAGPPEPTPAIITFGPIETSKGGNLAGVWRTSSVSLSFYVNEGDYTPGTNVQISYGLVPSGWQLVNQGGNTITVNMSEYYMETLQNVTLSGSSQFSISMAENHKPKIQANLKET